MFVSKTFKKVVLASIVLIVGAQWGAFKTVELDIDIGSSAFDYAALQKSEVRLT